jgi:hypothetical protein
MRYYHLFGDYDLARVALSAPEAVARELAWEGRGQGNPHTVSAALALASLSEMTADDAVGMLQELAMMYFQGDYGMEYLEEDFIVYLHSYGPDPAVRLDLARLLASEGLTERAIAQYNAVLQEDPQCEEAARELRQITGDTGEVP